MAEWAGVVATTITKYFRGETDEVMRNYKLLAMLNDRGLVSTNNSGTQVQWQPRFLQAPMSGFDDSDTLTFSRINRHKDAVLPWRGYSATDGMTERERLMNSGMEAIVKVWANKSKWMMEDVEQQIGTEFYVDGNAAGNSKRFHGIGSFTGQSGAIGGATPCATPNSTYAGLSCALGNYGGAWGATPWPNGTGNATYDFWSPIIVDYTNSFFGAASPSWANNCLKAVRFGMMASRRNASKKKQLDIVIHERQQYYDLVTLYQAEERINVMHNQPNGSSGLIKLGFGDIISIDGIDQTWEYGVPGAQSFGWCMNDVELMCLTPELLNPKGPTFDEASQTWRFWLTILANLKFEGIRNFVSWQQVS